MLVQVSLHQRLTLSCINRDSRWSCYQGTSKNKKILPSTRSASLQAGQTATKATKDGHAERIKGGLSGFSQPCGGETRPEWNFRGALTGAPARGWLRRTAIGGPGGPWVQAWTNKMSTVYLRLLTPSNYVLDCLGASCAGGVSTGRRTGGTSGGCRTCGAGGGGTVEDLHVLLLPDLHLQGLILLSPKLDTSHPVTSRPCCRLTVAALAARFPTLDTVAILLLTSCCRRAFALCTTMA